MVRYNEIKTDYLCGMTETEIIRKYNIVGWSKIRERIEEETGIRRKHIPREKEPSSEVKHYYVSKDGAYIVTKTLDNQGSVYFGSFRTKEQAEKAVKEYEKIGWDKSRYREIYQRIKNED